MENRNSKLSEELRDVLKTQQNVDGVIQKVNPIIQPVIDVNPKHARLTEVIAGNTRTTTGSATAYTTPSDKEFYLTGVNFSCNADVTADNLTYTVTITQGGANKDIFTVKKLTTTAHSANVYVPFNNPLKVDKNTNITFSTSFTVGSACMGCVVYGFNIDNQRA